MELLAAVDLRGGRAVRLTQGDFDRQDDHGDPVAVATRFVAGGARWLHVVDLDAARLGVPVQRETVVAIARQAGVPVQTGGGVRGPADVDELLAAGLARVVLGTAALDDPGLLRRCAERHPGRVALGLDYRRGATGTLEAAARGWVQGSGRTVGEMLEAAADVPLGAVVATGIAHDGTLAGPDLPGLAEVLAVTALPVVASGGVGTLEDLAALAALRDRRSGRALAGVVVGKALVENRFSVAEGVSACAASG